MKIRVPEWCRHHLRRIHHSDEGEIIFEAGGGWWIDCERTTGRVGLALIRLCVVKMVSNEHDDMKRYKLTEHGEQAIETGVIDLPDVLAVSAVALVPGTVFV